MADRPYDWYDTALFGNAVATHTLFTQPEGSATDKQSEDTNMRIGGQFAQGSVFTLYEIKSFVDDNLAVADVPLVYEQSYFKLIVDNKILLQTPTRMTVDHNTYRGQFNQGTNTDIELIGLEGDGYTLREPLVIKGGQQIKVELYQGTALSTTGQRVKMVLCGMFDDRSN